MAYFLPLEIKKLFFVIYKGKDGWGPLVISRGGNYGGLNSVLITLLIVGRNYTMAKYNAGSIRMVHPDWRIVLADSYDEAMRAAEIFDLNAAIINQDLAGDDDVDLLIELQEKNPCLSPIVLNPTPVPDKLRETLKICGAFDVLENPVDSDILIATVEGALARFSQRQSAA
jgi:DNA-binding NtrC family response regulator